MTTFLMGRREVEYVREAQLGDRGFNPSKPRMVLINVPGQGQRVVPFEKLTVIKGEKPVAEPKRRSRR